ncbi:MAG: hypothetical protein BRC47_07420 [Cyanobacteria bacterium QS_7_48_42]|nr:MAG: hypothetical protein BRC47_07420 [Cyanobacteria bacterium QS_7_48_42]
MHQLKLNLGNHYNYLRTQQLFRQRLNRNSLPLTLVAFLDTLPVGSVSLVNCDLDSHSHLKPWLASFLFPLLTKIEELVIG